MYHTIRRYMRSTDSSWYEIPKKSLYHDLISLVISQGISFARARHIKKKLYEMTGQDDWSCHTVASLDLSKLGLSRDKIATIKNITQHACNNTLDIHSIPGIGPWTIKALLVLQNLDENIFLFEDKWIRARLQIFETYASMTCHQAELLTKKWRHKSAISRFLWRIKLSGIEKMKQDVPLDRADFV